LRPRRNTCGIFKITAEEEEEEEEEERRIRKLVKRFSVKKNKTP
jgi:hypothetical protein